MIPNTHNHEPLDKTVDRNFISNVLGDMSNIPNPQSQFVHSYSMQYRNMNQIIRNQTSDHHEKSPPTLRKPFVNSTSHRSSNLRRNPSHSPTCQKSPKSSKTDIFLYRLSTSNFRNSLLDELSSRRNRTSTRAIYPSC